MTAPTNFTPGPSQLYFTVPDHARQAFKEGIPSLSHRSKAFEKIFAETSEGLRALIGIPQDFKIFFTGSATEIWERVIQNLVEHKSHHLVNGSFSRRFAEISSQCGKMAAIQSAADGQGFLQIDAVNDAELIAITQNETSTGVSLPLDLIAKARSQNPDAIIAVDAVSSLPYPSFSFKDLDTIFFSVQKGFGLPAGLGVWIVNERCIAKAQKLLEKKVIIGSYHNIPSLLSHAQKNQTPETPNVLGIYLLNKVVQDFNRRGINAIRNETEYKAAILYNALLAHPKLSPFVSDKAFQSRTVIVASCGSETEALSKFLAEKGLHAGDGYGANKKTQLRFANFPAHSKEQFELLVDSIGAFQA